MRPIALSKSPLGGLTAALLGVLTACGEPLTDPVDLQEADLPARFDNTPTNNPQTPEGVALGRALFYDPLLSQSMTVSCASCHQQQHAFSDPERFSEGFEGGQTHRNSMPLVNVRFYERGRMFWDERAATLEEQVLLPILDDVEMGLTEAELRSRVSEASFYPPMFEAAFGDPEITLERISLGLAQFVRSIVSTRSKFDEAVAATGTMQGPLVGLTAEENQGKALFFSGRTNCANCHVRGNGDGDGGNGPGSRGPAGGLLANLLAPSDDGGAPQGGAPGDDAPSPAVFFVNRPAHNGLSIEQGDVGLSEVTGDEDDVGKFKSPSLRNVELTGPYMHDGRFASLEAVIDHYNRGLVDHPNLDNRLQNNGRPRRMNLNAGERAALVAFLKTLTDPYLATDDRFADPFAMQEVGEAP